MAAVAAVAVLLENELLAYLTCGDDAVCADRKPRRWQGRLFDVGGRPMAGQVRLAFYSRPDDAGPVTAEADRAGRF